jgi:ADP-heptose:LPS heptosyltransferase
VSRRILIVRPYGIGNTILATPAFQLCRHLFPEARLEALMSPLGALTLGEWPVFDRVHLYPDSPPPDEYDRVLIFEPASPKVNAPFLDHPGLVRHRLGAWHAGRFLHRHEVETNLEIVAQLDARAASVPPFPLHCDAEAPLPDIAPAANTLGVHIGGKEPHQLAKRFAPDFWVDVLRPIAKTRPVLLVGGPDEADEAAAIASAIGGTSVAGKLPLAVTAGMIRACAAFIATDGGPMHIAACVGTPVVGVFSTTNMWRTRPWTTPGRSIVVKVSASPGAREVRAAARALTLLEEGGRHWLLLRGAGPRIVRSGRWWRRR